MLELAASGFVYEECSDYIGILFTVFSFQVKIHYQTCWKN